MKRRLFTLFVLIAVSLLSAAGGFGLCWSVLVVPARHDLADARVYQCEHILNSLYWLDKGPDQLREKLESGLLVHADALGTSLCDHPGADHFRFQIFLYYSKHSNRVTESVSAVLKTLPQAVPEPPPLRIYYHDPTSTEAAQAQRPASGM